MRLAPHGALYMTSSACAPVPPTLSSYLPPPPFFAWRASNHNFFLLTLLPSSSASHMCHPTVKPHPSSLPIIIAPTHSLFSFFSKLTQHFAPPHHPPTRAPSQIYLPWFPRRSAARLFIYYLYITNQASKYIPLPNSTSFYVVVLSFTSLSLFWLTNRLSNSA